MTDGGAIVGVFRPCQRLSGPRAVRCLLCNSPSFDTCHVLPSPLNGSAPLQITHRLTTTWAMATTSITPTPLHSREAGDQSERQVTLSSKEKKYDRQLRLWAASGQEALENANILLLNSGSGVVGIETLKNLILPGVGSFTIVDEAVVQEQDLGVNFFLTEDSLGKSRAAESCKYLRELNPEVTGRAVQKVRTRT